MESEKLLPCPNPWCGETQEVEPNRNMWSGCWHVGCGVCMLDGPVMATEAEAIAAWNTRAPADLRSALEAETIREAAEYASELREIAGMLAQSPDGPLRWKQYRLVAVADFLNALTALAPTKGDVS